MGTFQHTLLENGIGALHISRSVIAGEQVADKYAKEELTEALRSVSSIIGKCEKAQLKFAEGTPHYSSLNKVTRAMYIAEALIQAKLAGELEEELNSDGS